MFLTPREQEILVKLCEGLTYQAIAREIEISPHTVDAHIRRLRRKAGVN
ncbi:helix-turn-helix transcriptional regulator, partial [Streptomyces sp. MI02-7b]